MNNESQLNALRRENLRLKGDLQTIASRISHDLRTPLGGIITPAEYLKELLIEKDSSLVTVANSLLESAEELSRLITRVSFVTKASATPVPKQRMAMEKCVTRTRQRLESLTLKKHATITEPESWPEINGVELWLETIWWNLLTNALQHSGSSPHIQLGWTPGRQIQFWIQDSGPGVADQNISRLFQPFDSLHELNSTRGLGLSIVQRLVELQGGRCGHEAREDGAYFFFTLPTDEPSDARVQE